MRIKELIVHQLRNIHTAQFTLHPRTTLVYGKNGTGKTSLLEAIYLLCTGHSFRTRETSPLIHQGTTALTVFAHLEDEQSISIQKSLVGPTQVKINREPCRSSSQLARLFPCLVVYQDLFQIIDAGPSYRRALLDWGLFHVEPSYHEVWKDHRWVLKQRNALLRQRASRSLMFVWDQQLSELSEVLNQMRRPYFERWANEFKAVLSELTDCPCNITYEKGWDKKETGVPLVDILKAQFEQDHQRQYTQSGAHQADIQFEVGLKAARRFLSRGQQKMVLMALKIAQARLVPRACIYLLDDLSAELDASHLQRVLSCLEGVQGQLIFTALDETLLKSWAGSSIHLSG